MTLEELKAYGADTDAGLQRCMNNESFYLRLVKMIPGDDNFRKLKEALEVGNLDAAFEAAHALKGSSGNLALTPACLLIFGVLVVVADRCASPAELQYVNQNFVSGGSKDVSINLDAMSISMDDTNDAAVVQYIVQE